MCTYEATLTRRKQDILDATEGDIRIQTAVRKLKLCNLNLLLLYYKGKWPEKFGDLASKVPLVTVQNFDL